MTDFTSGVETSETESIMMSQLPGIWPICSQCTLSLSSENIWKPYDFLMFSEARERVYLEQMG